MKLNIQGKLVLAIISVSLIIYILSFGYISYNVWKTTDKQAKKIAQTYAKEYAIRVNKTLDQGIVVCRAIEQSFLSFDMLDYSLRERYYRQILKDVLTENEAFKSFWVNWEIGAIDSTYLKTHGRIRQSYYKGEAGRVLQKDDTLDLEQDNYEGIYYSLKVNPREIITDPYKDSYTGRDSILMSSVAVPIIKNGKFVGLVGADVELTQFQEIIQDVEPYEGSQTMLVSNGGIIIASTNSEHINKSLAQVYKDENEKNNVLSKLSNGLEFSYMSRDRFGKGYYYSYAPFYVGKSQTPWSLLIAVPLNKVLEESRDHIYVSILVVVLGLLTLSFAVWYYARRIARPLQKLTRILMQLAKGDIRNIDTLEIKSKDEIGKIRESVNNLVENYRKTARFANEIGEGNLDAQFNVLSERDIMGSALIEMRTSLRNARERDEKRRLMDQLQNWSNEGNALFANILRQNQDNYDDFLYNIIKNLVKYIRANQGGIFVLNEQDKDNIFAELGAAYAFERRKRHQKKVPLGVGLIGRCIAERETIYLTKVPDDYLNITSGLGEHTASSLLIVPLIFNEKIFGVVEIAKFGEFERYVIEFVEKISESIASTISNIQSNMQTVKLLEESRIQSEELASQEEEMRQNMEEMQASQEELMNKATELSELNYAMNSLLMIAYYDLQGRLVDINENYLTFLRIKREDIVGQIQGSMNADGLDIDRFNDLWKDLRNGKRREMRQTIKVGTRTVDLLEEFVPLYNQDDEVYKILNVSKVLKEL